MYHLMIWDKRMAAEKGDGCLGKIVIETPLAKKLFELNSEEFPTLSSLSFNDYDLFSDGELEILKNEFLKFLEKNKKYTEDVILILEKISEAQLTFKAVLFDPFTNNF